MHSDFYAKMLYHTNHEFIIFYAAVGWEILIETEYARSWSIGSFRNALLMSLDKATWTNISQLTTQNRLESQVHPISAREK